MTVEEQRWREKYLQLLEQQERQEARWEQRLDLLRRSLVRSSLVVEGADPGVEQCLRKMREILRDGDLDSGLDVLVPRLEKAVLDSERHRHERSLRLHEALQRLVAQLLALELPGEVRRALKRFGKQLDRRASQVRELPSLLGELGALQAQALQVRQPEPAPGLLRRLFGKRNEADGVLGEPITPVLAEEPASPPPLDEPGPDVAPTPLSLAAEVVERSADADADADADAGPDTAAPTVPAEPVVFQAASAADYALPESPDQPYSAIAEHVESTLRSLLDALRLPEHRQPQAEALRVRIQHGLNWYELVPVLDDLAGLMVAVSDQSQREFEAYLQTLNERLVAMQNSLAAAHQGHTQGREAADVLDTQLREQVGGLQTSMHQATDLASLKQAVQTRLDGLLHTVDCYKQQRSEQEQALGERLQQLVTRVGVLEEAARGLRENLSEQRQKTLEDSLTGLPNRAAWSERLEIEVSRWQRYGGDLLLAVIDIDHFKRINDDFGHLAGDRVLRIIATELRKRLRKTDFIARFGGEEFVLLLPATAIAAGQGVLEALRTAIEACPFHFKGERVQVTFSAGVTAFTGEDDGEQAFERADQALYRAKRAGRNRIEAG